MSLAPQSWSSAPPQLLPSFWNSMPRKQVPATIVASLHLDFLRGINMGVFCIPPLQPATPKWAVSPLETHWNHWPQAGPLPFRSPAIMGYIWLAILHILRLEMIETDSNQIDTQKFKLEFHFMTVEHWGAGVSIKWSYEDSCQGVEPRCPKFFLDCGILLTCERFTFLNRWLI